jgi:phthalate 4,5-cis-dihydrodiol dehydrogenase
MTEARIRIGAAGLGRAFMLMLPTFTRDHRVQLAAAADPRPEARLRFIEEFGGRAYPTVEELCSDPEVEAVYIATPHQFHAGHAKIAAACGKHILIEKPMALTIAECTDMIEAAGRAGIVLIVGHSHSFDAPIKKTSELIEDGEFGAVRAITAMNFTDFVYRPRRREELITSEGGGVIFSQAAHQIDMIRLLGGGLVQSVRAGTGAWDAARGSEGAYSALLTFESGLFASAAYSGYAHFDTDEFCGWIGELGQPKDARPYGAARRNLEKVLTAEEEEKLKARRTYGGMPREQAGGGRDSGPPAHQHFGFVLVSCDGADLRPMPQGVMIYGHDEQRMEYLPPPRVPRSEVIDELFAAVRNGKQPLHGGEWARATLEACLAILQSSRENREIVLARQLGIGKPAGFAGRSHQKAAPS